MTQSIAPKVALIEHLSADSTHLEEKARQVCRDGLKKNISSEKRRRGWLAGRAAFFSVLESMELAPLYIDNDEKGRPFVEDNDSIFVSITHNDRWAAAALAPTAIGIDLEDPKRDVGRALDRFLHPKEIKMKENLSPLSLWCAKEAFGKFLGVGLVQDLSRFQFIQEQSDFLRVVGESSQQSLSGDVCIKFFSGEDFTMAVSSQRSTLSHLRLEQLVSSRSSVSS